MILLKVSGGFAQTGKSFGGRVALVELVEIPVECLKGLGDSFCYVIACFYANGNNLKLVFSSSVRGEVSYTCSS